MLVKCVDCKEFKAKVPKTFARKHNIDEFICYDCAMAAQEQFKEMDLYDEGLKFDKGKLDIARDLFKDGN